MLEFPLKKQNKSMTLLLQDYFVLMDIKSPKIL